MTQRACGRTARGVTAWCTRAAREGVRDERALGGARERAEQKGKAGLGGAREEKGAGHGVLGEEKGARHAGKEREKRGREEKKEKRKEKRKWKKRNGEREKEGERGRFAPRSRRRSRSRSVAFRGRPRALTRPQGKGVEMLEIGRLEQGKIPGFKADFELNDGTLGFENNYRTI